MFALVDVNSFYASCEKVFRPDINGKPIIVLSNNDGCVIARNNEAKRLGIKMGHPYFKIPLNFIKQHDIQVFSSNYALYADMSNRVIETLEMLTPRIEVYSIDEAFCQLPSSMNHLPLELQGKIIRNTIKQYTHLTVGVGIAPTKTLAKLANYAAKKWPQTNGVVDLSDIRRQHKLMTITPVSEVWGVGKKLHKQFNAMNIYTAMDLARLSPHQIRKKFNIIVERTVRELNGEPCLSLEEMIESRKQIICSRSFGEKVTQFNIMREAICNYTARAAEKLRSDQLYCQHITIFIKTSPFNKVKPYYSNYGSEALMPTNDTRKLLASAQKILSKIWLEGEQYQKAGVILNNFCSNKTNQFDMFSNYTMQLKNEKLMKTIDKINNSHNCKLFFASQGVKGQWHMKQQFLSPAYTTQIKDIANVKIT